jgi:hypothetical protein
MNWAAQVVSASASSSSSPHGYAVAQFARWHGELAPTLWEIYVRLDVPEWDVYRNAVIGCAADAYKAAHSAGHLLAITVRPILILAYIVGQFLFRNLLEHGGRSLREGAVQLRFASIWMYRFQRSLTWTEILGEVIVVTACVALYHFRRWLQRQTYWARAVRWYRGRKERAIQVRDDNGNMGQCSVPECVILQRRCNMYRVCEC